MPQKMWKHTCSKGGLCWIGTEVCTSCGRSGEYDGWHPRMHEAMARYQTHYGLKPMGPHRTMADELFKAVKARCDVCGGRGLLDSTDRDDWQVCERCRGFGSVFTKPAQEIAALRRSVLARYPEAAADALPGFFTGILAFSGAKEEVVDLSRPAAPRADAAIFDGFPYLVVQISPELFHITLLPETLSERLLAGIALVQWRTNRLNVCLVLGPRQTVLLRADGSYWVDRAPDWGGIPITGRLKLAKEWPNTEDVQARRPRLARFIEAQTPKGNRVVTADSAKGGREANAEDVARLAGAGPDDAPRGLERCATCGEWRGQCLDPSPELFLRVMTVYCRCANDNRCAACGLLLYKRKLNANYYDPRDGKVWHVPGIDGLGHECPDMSGRTLETRDSKAS